MNRLAIALVAGTAAAAVSGAALAEPAAAPAAPAGIAPTVINLIEKACLPMIKRQDPKAVATSLGMKRSHDDWVLLLPGVQKVTLTPPTGANPTVCILQLNYELDGAKALVDALSAWSAAQTPPLVMLGNAFSNTPGTTGWSWSVEADQMQEGLVFNAQRTADNKPLGRGYDVGTVLFSYKGP
jgi:hypothetical protein